MKAIFCRYVLLLVCASTANSFIGAAATRDVSALEDVLRQINEKLKDKNIQPSVRQRLLDRKATIEYELKDDGDSVQSLRKKIAEEQSIFNQISDQFASASDDFIKSDLRVRKLRVGQNLNELFDQLAQAEGTIWFYPEDILLQVLQVNESLMGCNTAAGTYKLPDGLVQSLNNQLIHLLSFEQASTICGFASLANLYAVNHMIESGVVPNARDIRMLAMGILKAISEGSVFQELAQGGQGGFEFANTLQLNQAARDIGLQNVFILGAQSQYITLESVIEGRDVASLLSIQSYPSFGISLFPNETQASVRAKIENIVASLRENRVTSFILNLGRTHWTALSVVHQGDDYIMYYLDSLNGALSEVASKNAINLICFIDQLIMIAKGQDLQVVETMEDAGPAVATTGTASFAASASSPEILMLKDTLDQIDRKLLSSTIDSITRSRLEEKKKKIQKNIQELGQ